MPTPNLISIADILYTPEGELVNGEVSITNTSTMLSPDGYEIPQGTTYLVNVVDGVFNIGLVPNIGSTPVGTSYLVTYKSVTQQKFSEYWVVPGSGPVTLQDVRSLFPPVPTPMFAANQVIPPSGMMAGQVLTWNGSGWVPGTGGGDVNSVFGRTGVVIAETGDYSIDQITGAVTSVFGRTGAVVAEANDYSSVANLFLGTPNSASVTFDGVVSGDGNGSLYLVDASGSSIEFDANNDLVLFANDNVNIQSSGVNVDFAANVGVSDSLGSLWGSPTGGSQGANTINAEGLFVNGVAVSTSTTEVKVNGTDISIQNPVNFESGTDIAVSNPSAGNIQFSFTGQLAQTIGATSHEWLNSYNASTGLFTASQPAYSDISGTPQLANTFNAVSHEFLTAYNASTGNFTAAQPAYSDLTGTPTLPVNTPATTHEFITAYNSSTGAFTQAQPAYTDISGTPQLAQTIGTVSHEFLTSYTASTGLFTQAQPAYSDLSGTPQLPQTDSGSTHHFLTSYTASTGLFTDAQPAFSDISGTLATASQLDHNTVGLTDSTGLFTVSGSPAALGGSITLSAFASQTANTVLRSGSGSPSFSSLAVADLPTSGTWAFAGTLSGAITFTGNDTSTLGTAIPGIITSTAGFSLLQNTTPTVVGDVTTLALSTSTAPTNISGNIWQYTYAVTESGSGTNGYVGASITISGYTGGATGNNGTFIITASTTTAFQVTNASGTATHTGTPVIISSGVVNSPIIQIAGTVNTGTAGTLNSVPSVWSLQNIIGSLTPNPTSTLTYTYSGGVGIAAVAVPKLITNSPVAISMGLSGVEFCNFTLNGSGDFSIWQSTNSAQPGMVIQANGTPANSSVQYCQTILSCANSISLTTGTMRAVDIGNVRVMPTVGVTTLAPNYGNAALITCDIGSTVNQALVGPFNITNCNFTSSTSVTLTVSSGTGIINGATVIISGCTGTNNAQLNGASVTVASGGGTTTLVLTGSGFATGNHSESTGTIKQQANGTITQLMINGKETAVGGTHNLLDLQAGSAGTTSKFKVDNSGNVTAQGYIDIANTSSPTSAGTAGVTGQIAWDSGKIYVCTSGGAAGAATWKAATLSSV